MRKLLSTMALFVISLLVMPLALAQNSNIGGLEPAGITVEVNDEEAGDSRLTIEEGEKLSIDVELEIPALLNVDIDGDEVLDAGDVDTDDGAYGIEVVARLSGYEYSDRFELEDSTPVFDVREGTRKTVHLELEVPNDLHNGLNTLRIFVLDRNSGTVDDLTQTFALEVESPRHSLDIVDVDFSPSNTRKAGQSLLASVVLENLGENDEEDVRVTVEVPELGIKATEFVDEIGADDQEDVPQMWLPIPVSAAEGDYTVEVTAEYDRYDTVTRTFTIHVLASELLQAEEDALVLAVGPEVQNVVKGQTAVYAVALTNAGTRSTAYQLQVMTGDWATSSLSDNLVVLEAGKNKVVYVEVTPSAGATAGEHVTSLSISAGDETLETISLRANVAEGAAGNEVSLRNGLEIALIVLVVLLVIIGLIIGFSRMKKDKGEEEQQYY